MKKTLLAQHYKLVMQAPCYSGSDDFMRKTRRRENVKIILHWTA